MSLKLMRFLITFACILALLVVMLGAYTRLTDAGLGCPDWPGCYGHMVLPTAHNDLVDAERHYPLIPIESRKAWTEMVHRYAAGTLALLIIVIGINVGRFRQTLSSRPSVLPWVLILLVAFQAALGMWTVTLKLLPVVVMSHLLGGMLIFSILCYFRAQLSDLKPADRPRLRFWLSLGIVIVFCQIAFGGWVSSNYAGLACIGFPRCNGLWLPALHFSKGFNLFSTIGANYQGGLLESDARVTIQFIHRLFAMVAASYVVMLSLVLIFCSDVLCLQRIALIALILVAIQFALGIANVVYFLPLWIAVLHNGVAALLLATMCAMRYFATGGTAHVRQY